MSTRVPVPRASVSRELFRIICCFSSGSEQKFDPFSLFLSLDRIKATRKPKKNKKTMAEGRVGQKTPSFIGQKYNDG